MSVPPFNGKQQIMNCVSIEFTLSYCSYWTETTTVSISHYIKFATFLFFFHINFCSLFITLDIKYCTPRWKKKMEKVDEVWREIEGKPLSPHKRTVATKHLWFQSKLQFSRVKYTPDTHYTTYNYKVEINFIKDTTLFNAFDLFICTIFYSLGWWQNSPPPFKYSNNLKLTKIYEFLLFFTGKFAFITISVQFSHVC